MKLISIISAIFLVLALASISHAKLVHVYARMGFLQEDQSKSWHIDDGKTYVKDIGYLYCHSVFPGADHSNVQVRNSSGGRLDMGASLSYSVSDGTTFLVRCW